ncbi:suppressor of cytokine signaling 2-like isoform X2 [Cimex lectularius]|nr:suppressor of cytokine signaling 2-like isoform X2 [Cimex lectularius]XP_014261520.1 suppressor of cytokine signaling 2-like isoform X2 [Cimex lectularius]XP_024081294.1 suppressor of cytokine signaling 2-like isoform X2 [Cimex lectularius]
MLTSCPRCQHTFRSPCCGGGSPEASPSLPLTFILPSPPISAKPTTKADLSQPSDLDLKRISATMKRLKASGWFYEGITWQESMSILASTKPGTFLVRESSDPRYLFSLSVQGLKGPVSVRIHYVNGYFRLDAEPALGPVIPFFDCVVKLVEYYIYTSNNSRSCNTEHVFVDWTGHNYSHILLRKPLYQRTKFPSLKHLARLRINSLLKIGDTVPNLDIPVTLKDYLQEYPYTH